MPDPVYHRVRDGMVISRTTRSVTLADVYHVVMDGPGDPAGAVAYMVGEFPIGTPYPSEPFFSDDAVCDGHRFYRQIDDTTYRIAVVYTINRRFVVFPQLRRWSTTSEPIKEFLLPVYSPASGPDGEIIPIYTPVPFTRYRYYRYETLTLTEADQNAVTLALYNYRNRPFSFGIDPFNLYLLIDAATRGDGRGRLITTYRFESTGYVPGFVTGVAPFPDMVFGISDLYPLEEYLPADLTNPGSTIGYASAEEIYGQIFNVAILPGFS